MLPQSGRRYLPHRHHWYLIENWLLTKHLSTRIKSKISTVPLALASQGGTLETMTVVLITFNWETPSFRISKFSLFDTEITFILLDRFQVNGQQITSVRNTTWSKIDRTDSCHSSCFFISGFLLEEGRTTIFLQEISLSHWFQREDRWIVSRLNDHPARSLISSSRTWTEKDWLILTDSISENFNVTNWDLTVISGWVSSLSEVSSDTFYLKLSVPVKPKLGVCRFKESFPFSILSVSFPFLGLVVRVNSDKFLPSMDSNRTYSIHKRKSQLTTLLRVKEAIRPWFLYTGRSGSLIVVLVFDFQSIGVSLFWRWTKYNR